jgi:4-hydroxyphenylpyruvate dioxygenase
MMPEVRIGGATHPTDVFVNILVSSLFIEMKFNHLHFYVDQVTVWHERLVQTWGATSMLLDAQTANPIALLCLGQIPLLLSEPEATGGAVADYLDGHPPGIGDLAFCVKHLDALVQRVLNAGGNLTQPVQQDRHQPVRWCQIQGWGTLRHTLVEPLEPGIWIPPLMTRGRSLPTLDQTSINHIDHAVLNVATGQLATATAWYEQQLGFQPQQRFAINTPYSGLNSQVLVHPEGPAQLPINEPTTPNSQVQEFLDWNQGAGIQHIALHSQDIFQTVQQWRNAGVAFLEVPASYYDQLAQRPDYQAEIGELAAIARLQLLVDWAPHLPQAQLLQTFTQPLFDQPTLFFEVIQRRTATVNGQQVTAQGFGERNFLALFEAIEREQTKRGSLAAPRPTPADLASF